MKSTNNTSFIKLSLISLLLGGFSIGMTEFLMMGILADMSHALGISIPEAGHLISIYALGVVIGAPLMVGLTANLPPKKVLIGLMLMVAVFNGLFGLVSSYPLLMATRFLAGLPHGAFFGIGAVVASKLAQSGREARAVSVMFAGLTLANILGVPLGTFIGHHYTWRYSFALIALVAVAAALAVKFWMPHVKSESETSFLKSLNIFKHKELWFIIGISAIGTGGMFAWISYISPLMTEVAGFSPNSMTIIMVVAGLGMVVGNIIGGRLADRFSPLLTTTTLLLCMVAALLLTVVLAQYKPTALIMTFLTGAIGFGVIAPMQMLIVQQAKGAEMLASSLLQATSNMGNALGAFLGGLPIAAGFGYASPEYVGAALAFTGVLFCLLLLMAHKKKASQLAVN
ncbi:MFS transporter [Rufibacter roseus]|uniref:MFS transporter n=1 Tax=Rufibacter roseus TaxID=1567108 RepID=A0ABW2DKM9_9BACT|nr:MFS transporter [Rufibacter roseus]